MKTFIINTEDPRFQAISDRVFLGEGLFETIRVSNKQAHYPEMHWERLNTGASFLGIPFDVSYEVWFGKLTECIETSELKQGGIKILLGSGPAKRGLENKTEHSYLSFHPFNYEKITTPLKLLTSSWRRDDKNPIFSIKSINYLEGILAKRQALEAGYDDVLFLNQKDYVTETTIANIFLIINETIYTPSLSCGLLDGVIRKRVLQLCKTNGIPYHVGEIDSSLLFQADALFTTNSLQGLRSVCLLDQKPYDCNHPLIARVQGILEKDAAFNHYLR